MTSSDPLTRRAAEVLAAVERMTPGPWLVSAERRCVDTAQIADNGDVCDGYSFGLLGDDDDITGADEHWPADARGVVILRNEAPGVIRDLLADRDAQRARAEAAEEHTRGLALAHRDAYLRAERLTARVEALRVGLSEACDIADRLNAEVHSAYGEMDDIADRRVDVLRALANPDAGKE